MKSNKLYRSRNDKILGGVCAGLGQYLDIDPVLIRLFFLVLILFGEGIGLLVYFILWLIIPLTPLIDTESSVNEEEYKDLASRAKDMGDELKVALESPNPQGRLYFGGALIALGVIFVLQNLNIRWLWWVNFDILWPGALIIAGLVLIIRYFRKNGYE